MCSNRCPTTRSDVLKRFHLINCCSLFDNNTFDNSSGVVVDEIWLSLVVGEVTVDWMVACCICSCYCLFVARRIFSTCTFCIASLALRTFHGGVVFVDAAFVLGLALVGTIVVGMKSFLSFAL